MSCLFNHRWIYDFRLFHVYRKCRFCSTTERHARRRGSAHAEWESVQEHVILEPEPRRIAQGRYARLLRLAHSLGLLRAGTSDWTRY